MNMKHFGTFAVASLLLSGAAPALAATIVIDDFDTFQSVTDAPAGGQTASSTIPFAALGGSRTLTADNTLSGANDQNATTLTSGGGRLAFSNNESATGRGTVTFSGLNLSAQSDSFFTFGGVDETSFDNGFDLDFGASAEDSDGTVISFSEYLGDGFSPILSFMDFTEGESLDDFNFGEIASLSFFVDSTGRSTRVDGSLGSITLTTDLAPIPLPAAGFLLLGGLGGLAALRRLKKA